MMRITAPRVNWYRLRPVGAVVQVQTSHQLSNFSVLLLLFGQRVAILSAEAQRGQTSVTSATMLRPDAVRERSFVQVALSPVDSSSETRLVLWTVGLDSVHLCGGKIRVRSGQSSRCSQSRGIRFRMLPSASVPGCPVRSSWIDGCSRWRRHYRQWSVHRNDRSGRWDRSEPFRMVMSLPRQSCSGH